MATHTHLIARLNAVTTPEDFAAVFAAITRLDKPGFPDDLADGDYFDGFFFATKRSGRLALTQMHHLSDRLMEVWTEVDATERDERATAADQAEEERDVVGRGRPEIGRTIGVRMPEWMIRIVDQHAERYGVPRAEAARALILAGSRAAETR